MKRLAVGIGTATALSLSTISGAVAEIEPEIEFARPPQFVMIAFDNCAEVTRWRELSEFLRELNKTGNPVRLTFFVSGVNFLSRGNRKLYKGPRRSAGRANIDFGGSLRDVATRISLMNKLHHSGNEIASHAVGHFDAGSSNADWSTDEWRREFKTFNTLFDRVAINNATDELNSPPPLAFLSSKVVGFRAPYLSTNSAMYRILKQFGFRYDTSTRRSSKPDAWPKRHKSGLWLFNLARLAIQRDGRSARRTLSMDYNFCATQSREQGDSCEIKNSDSELTRRYGREMYDTYVKYFTDNYMGNRAPLHIGHHFSAYQGDTYNKALKAFARKVCKMKEVRCVTYRELANYMDALPPDTLAAYQKGAFSHAGIQLPRLRASKLDTPEGAVDTQ